MTGRRERILIVDDEPALRRLLHQTLAREGFHCEEAGGGDEALNEVRNGPAELVILDVKMPGKSGVELLPKIRAKCPDTAIIMATAVTDSNVAIQCMKEGAYDYITKPFSLDQVVLSVERALEKRRLELENRDYQQHLERKVREETRRIREILLSAMESVVSALEATDSYTAGHSRRVAEIAVTIGREMGLSESMVEDLRWAGLLHDIGKIAVDQSIQKKPGKLTSEEYEHIMIHPQLGASIMEKIVNMAMVEAIRHHHDRYDGSGLKQILAGEDIPLGARILAMADAYDAMTSTRHYRPALTVEEALEEVRRGNGTQFDPVVVNAFLKTLIPDSIPKV
jgi:putative two-component system response regulator